MPGTAELRNGDLLELEFRRASVCRRKYIFPEMLLQLMRRSTVPSYTLYETSETCSSYAAKIEFMFILWRRPGLFKHDIGDYSTGVMLLEVSLFDQVKLK